jgi:hypothetical protein
MRSMPSPNIGLLQLLVSAANKSASQVKLGNVQAVEQGNGKVYKVSRRFFPRLSESNATSLEYCPTDGDVVKPLYDEIEITNKTVSQKIKIDDELIRCIKESRADYQNSYVNEVLRNHINRLGKEVATVVANNGFIGSFVKCDCADPAVTSKSLPLFLSSGLGINPVGESILDSDRKQAEIEQQLILVGGTLLDQYRKARVIASGNDNGFDASLLEITRSIYYDTNLPAALGNTSDIIAMAPGALQLVTYAKNKGQFTYDFEDQMRTTVVDPWLGIEHDVVMSYVKCNDEIELYIQFATNWAVVGMPKCWAVNDCLFDGVLDVFKYEVVCADTGYCDIEPACGFVAAPNATDATFCESADACEVACNALFYSKSVTGELFYGISVDKTDAVAIQINGLPFSVGGSFDTGTEAGANNFVAAAQTALASVNSIYTVAGGWDGTALTIYVFANDTVTSVVIVSAATTDVALTNSTETYINVYSASTPSTGATLTDLAWTLASATFNGAPNDQILNENTAFGTYANFYASTNQAGTSQLIITDSVDCNDTYNGTI